MPPYPRYFFSVSESPRPDVSVRGTRMNDSPWRFRFWMLMLVIPSILFVAPIVFFLFSHVAFPLYPKPRALLGLFTIYVVDIIL